MIRIASASKSTPIARKRLEPASIDFAAREQVLTKLDQEYETSLNQLEELNSRLESCLSILTGKPAPQATAPSPAAQAAPLREAA